MNELEARIAGLEALVAKMPSHTPDTVAQKAMDDTTRRLQALEARFAEREAVIANKAADAALAAVEKRIKASGASTIQAVGEVLSGLRAESMSMVNKAQAELKQEINARDLLQADSFSRAEALVLNSVARLSGQFRN